MNTEQVHEHPVRGQRKLLQNKVGIFKSTYFAINKHFAMIILKLHKKG